MTNKTLLKSLGFASAIALSVATPEMAYGQAETVNVSFTTTSTINTVDVSDMDFGTFMVIVAGGDNPTITLTDDGNATATVANNANSTVTQIIAPATEGVVTVETPAPVVLTMTRSASVDFADANLSLTSVTYNTATENSTAINANGANGPVTVVAGATPEAVNFGGVITATATPGDAAHTATFLVTFTF